MITTPAGYISGSMRYYYLKDYQGNNSVVLNQNGVVQQINHYYPYGSLMGDITIITQKHVFFFVKLR